MKKHTLIALILFAQALIAGCAAPTPVERVDPSLIQYRDSIAAQERATVKQGDFIPR